jgi:phytoene desaturase
VGRRLIPDIHDRIATKFHYAPTDFETDLSAYMGSAFSLEPILTQSAWFRGHNRDDVIPICTWSARGRIRGRVFPALWAAPKPPPG